MDIESRDAQGPWRALGEPLRTGWKDCPDHGADESARRRSGEGDHCHREAPFVASVDDTPVARGDAREDSANERASQKPEPHVSQARAAIVTSYSKLPCIGARGTGRRVAEHDGVSFHRGDPTIAQ
jgi:hypothetical protein